jgi:NAD/NADP transhydrogenase beta subunit
MKLDFLTSLYVFMLAGFIGFEVIRRVSPLRPSVPPFMMAVLGMEVILGSLTFTGSLMAAGKLQEVLPQRPITYKGQNFVNLGVLAIAVIVAIIWSCIRSAFISTR